MARRRRPGARLLLACALLAAGSALAGAAAGEEKDALVFKKLERTINLKSPIVAVSDAIDARAAAGAKGAPSRVLLCYTRFLADRLAYLELEVDGKAQEGAWSSLPDAEVEALGAPSSASGGAGCFAFPLDASGQAALKPGAKAAAQLAAYAAFARVLVPRPEAVPQGEPQHVLFRDDALRAVSPYRVEQQAVEALVPPGARPSSFRPGAPVGALKSSSSGAVLKFAPPGATEPWGALQQAEEGEESGKSGLSVHFKMDEPLVRGARVVREVQVSQWGNVYFEETYLVRNDGPRLSGEFSRRRYSDRSAYSGYMFENLRARLPARARWIYFRDAIGNVSTSDVHRLPAGYNAGGGGKRSSGDSGGVVVDLGVRYPMLGGWEVDFVLGYSLPLDAVVSRVAASGAGGAGGAGGRWRLRLRVPLPPPIEGMYTDDLEVRVVLPEGARDVAHRAPSAPNARASLERKSTYLDAPWGKGRPVLALRLRDAVPEHGSSRLTVEYTLSRLDMVRKPLLLVGAYGLVFAALALYNRADFSIAPAAGGGGGGKGRPGSAAAKAKAA